MAEREADTLESAVVLQGTKGAPIPDILSKTLALLHAADEEGVRSYRALIEELRGSAAAYVSEIAAVDERVPTDAYPLRWSLRHILADLEHPSAVDFLLEDATREMPIIRGDEEGQGCEPMEEGELLLAVMSVEGLARLQVVDRALAQETLAAVAERQGHVAVRGAAVHALLVLAPEWRERLEEILPERQRWLLERRLAAPEDVTANRDEMDLRAAPKSPLRRGPQLPEDSSAPLVEGGE